MSEFVDANIFVRFLTGDDPGKAEQCLDLFQRAQRGDATLVTSESVIAEVAYVLGPRSRYQIPGTTIADALRKLILIQSFRIDHKQSVLLALERWKSSNLDFEDCLSAEHVRREGLDGIYSYDRDFDHIPGIRRLEP